MQLADESAEKRESKIVLFGRQRSNKIPHYGEAATEQEHVGRYFRRNLDRNMRNPRLGYYRSGAAVQGEVRQIHLWQDKDDGK